MTTTEHQEFAAIERTCDEIRKDIIDLQSEIVALHQDMCRILVMNSLGKTKEIADLINVIIAHNKR